MKFDFGKFLELENLNKFLPEQRIFFYFNRSACGKRVIDFLGKIPLHYRLENNSLKIYFMIRRCFILRFSNLQNKLIGIPGSFSFTKGSPVKLFCKPPLIF